MTLDDFDLDVVRSVSRSLRSKYHGYVDYADLAQELTLWLLEHEAKLDEWRETYSNPRTYERVLARSLRNAGERYCRREKAEQVGYSVDDEFYYSIGMCGDLLQLYFDPEYMIPGSIELGQTSSGKPASEGGNLVAMVADVGRAYELLSQADKDLLEFVYGGKMPVRDAINFLSQVTWDISYRAADARIRRVMGRLRKFLGGPRPYEED